MRDLIVYFPQAYPAAAADGAIRGRTRKEDTMSEELDPTDF
jgi:hypothetical protein